MLKAYLTFPTLRDSFNVLRLCLKLGFPNLYLQINFFKKLKVFLNAYIIHMILITNVQAGQKVSILSLRVSALEFRPTHTDPFIIRSHQFLHSRIFMIYSSVNVKDPLRMFSTFLGFVTFHPFYIVF